MSDDIGLDELMICRLGAQQRTLEPCAIVIFGASGDLTKRKLIPALYHLFIENQLPDPVRIVGFARREKTDEEFRAELREGFEKYSRSRGETPSRWSEFEALVSYHRGSFDDPAAYVGLRERIESFNHEGIRRNALFYLATSPTQFAEVASQLSASGLLRKDEQEDGWQRLVIEKPFGSDLESAQRLNRDLVRVAHERQIYRIDHYLGKETVQNILIFRFSNELIERNWARDAIDHVQITVSEQFSVGGRGGYYEHAGALRDMVQNHLLQVMALISMEPPQSLEAEAIRDEKVKALRSIRSMHPSQVDQFVVRGQYVADPEAADSTSYRDEDRVDPKSNVETFVALKLFVDNWRWSGVPFYLRTGKNLPVSASEVRVQFRPTPNVLFAAECGARLNANSITLRLQPNEGITLHINGKIPGSSNELRPVRMRFSYDSEFGAYTPEAYERLLLEAIAGDPTLFIRRDELETAWEIVDQIRQGWGDRELTPEEFYKAGTWGPERSDALLKSGNRAWRHPKPSNE